MDSTKESVSQSQAIQPENRSTKPRLVTVCRDQYEIHYDCLDSLIEEDHPARRVWEYVQLLDLSSALRKIKSVEGDVGRPAIDPKILLAVWLYATIEGIGSAWGLGDYCKQHNAFKWICGNVPIDRKTLSNFRANSCDTFDELLIQGVAILTHSKQVTLKEIAHDGLRTRASAGRNSFCREETLRKHLESAKARVEFLRQELNNDPVSSKTRIKIAQAVQAKARVERLENSMKELEKIRKEKDFNRVKNRKKKLSEKEKAAVRVSRTDPEARILIMADNGYRPAFNIQFAVDTPSQVIAGVDISNCSNDSGLMLPMFETIKNTYQKMPEIYLADSGFKKIEDIIVMGNQGCKVYTPSENSKDAKTKKVDTEKHNDQSIIDWLSRMDTEEGKEIYKRRASSVECVNAHARNCGLYQFHVRGMKKVKGEATLMAVAHNMTRTFAFGII